MSACRQGMPRTWNDSAKALSGTSFASTSRPDFLMSPSIGANASRSTGSGTQAKRGSRPKHSRHAASWSRTFDGDQLCFDPADSEALFILPRNDDVARRVGPGFTAAVEWMLSGALNPWVEGWTFEVGTNRAEVRQTLDGRSLGDAARAIAALGEHAHVVELPHRKTFFLPGIGGRLSLYEEEDEGVVGVDFTYDETANPAAVDLVVAAVRGD